MGQGLVRAESAHKELAIQINFWKPHNKLRTREFTTLRTAGLPLAP